MKWLWIRLGRIFYWLNWPVLFMFLDNERTRVVVRADNKILVVKDWMGDGSWKLPGGGVHGNEEFSASAQRELLEETGIKANTDQLVSKGIFEAHSHGKVIKYHLYLLQLPKIPEIKKQKIEIVDISWKTPKQLTESAKIKDYNLAIINTCL